MPGPVSVLRVALACGVLALAGCTRGCNYGPPAEPCAADGDCTAPAVCFNGWCSSPEYVAFARKCRADPICGEEGKCDALTVRSFLGANTGLECAAVKEEDCDAARVCASRGLCSVFDGWCVAAMDSDCAGSERCRTHDECGALHHECVRRWPACTPLAPPAGAPAWADTRDLGVTVDMTRMPAAWQPGAVAAGSLVCEVRLAASGAGRVRVGGSCTGTEGLYFTVGEAKPVLLTGVALRPGDEVAAAVQVRWETGRAATDSFVKAKYAGASPFRGGAGEETLTCHVLDAAALRALAADALAVADAALATARAVKARHVEAAPLTEVRRAIDDAALWLGWSDAEIVGRLQQVADIEARWSEQLAGLIVKQRAHARRPLAAAPSSSRGDLSVQMVGHVCGAQLAARREGGRAADDGGCGVEVLIANTGKDAREFKRWSDGELFYLRDLRFLRVADGAGELIDVEMIDILLRAPGAVRERSAEIPAGGSAVVLLAGKQRDVPLAVQGPEAFTLLSGRAVFGDAFLLRTELTPEPEPAPTKRRKGKTPR